MGQHLGSIKNQNALRSHLKRREISAEQCQQFDLVAHGPVHPEVVKPPRFERLNRTEIARLMAEHRPIRDIVGAMEKRLSVELRDVGYDVMNIVKSSFEVPDEDWRPIREAFAVDFPQLKARG